MDYTNVNRSPTHKKMSHSLPQISYAINCPKTHNFIYKFSKLMGLNKN